MNGERSVISQIEQPQLIPLIDVQNYLFPQKEAILPLLFEKIKPPPLNEQPLLLLRTMPDRSIRGFLLGKNRPLEDLRITADDFERLAEKMSKKKISGIVLFIEPEQLEKTEEIVALLVPLLEQKRKVQGKLWVLENIGTTQKLSKEEKELRETILEANGLVKTKVVGVGKEPFVLWYSRKEKETARAGVDLTNRYLFQKYLKEMTAELRLAGWAKVDASEITEVCRGSHFALRDYRWLKDGRGIKATAHCGCTWHVDLAGNWTKLPGSHDPECEGVLKPIKRDEAGVGKGEPKAELMTGRIKAEGMFCNKCHGQLFFDRRVIGETDDGKDILVLSELDCPSCPSGSSIKSIKTLRFPKG